MSSENVAALVWSVLILGVPALIAVFATGAVPIPTQRGRARRQVEAIEAWAGRRDLWEVHDRARGYYAVRDWLGVEAAYCEARRIVDREDRS